MLKSPHSLPLFIKYMVIRQNTSYYIASTFKMAVNFDGPLDLFALTRCYALDTLLRSIQDSIDYSLA